MALIPHVGNIFFRILVHVYMIVSCDFCRLIRCFRLILRYLTGVRRVAVDTDAKFWPCHLHASAEDSSDWAILFQFSTVQSWWAWTHCSVRIVLFSAPLTQHTSYSQSESVIMWVSDLTIVFSYLSHLHISILKTHRQRIHFFSIFTSCAWKLQDISSFRNTQPAYLAKSNSLIWLFFCSIA